MIKDVDKAMINLKFAPKSCHFISLTLTKKAVLCVPMAHVHHGQASTLRSLFTSIPVQRAVMLIAASGGFQS